MSLGYYVTSVAIRNGWYDTQVDIQFVSGNNSKDSPETTVDLEAFQYLYRTYDL